MVARRKMVTRQQAAFSHGIKLAGTKGRGVVAGSRGKDGATNRSAKRRKSARAEESSVRGSPFPGFKRPSQKDVIALHRQLALVFGERRPSGTRKRRDIMDTVVGTILSQNTTNTNSHAAFTKLKRRFPTWDAVLKAKPSNVEKEIRCGGLAPKKTKWIQHICRTLHDERGAPSFSFLRKESKERVHAELERFTGVGKKTAAIINLFDVGHPDMAVDTHVFRYAEQLGWVPSVEDREAHNKLVTSSRDRWPVVTRDTAYEHLDATFPDGLKYSMHLILTDTVGGLPTVCPARSVLGFGGGKVTVDGVPLRDAVRAQRARSQ